MEIRTRYAPSPTGPFHLGGARTALFNLLFAKPPAGKFILRIEDTDKARSLEQYEKSITNGLSWLGINWGEFYRQSERIEIHKKYLKKLIDSGNAYLSKESKGERSEVIRFKNPKKRVEFEDIVRGKIEFDTSDLGDFVVAKSLDEPLYHLAVVVDDAEMKISHVIRGEDHISNTPRQILLQSALTFPQPIYAHLPLILGPDRSKLSKRHSAESVEEYKNQGYLPEALYNFLALLGWHPEGDKEVMSKDELFKSFSLERVGKAGAIFDNKKMDWMNGEYIREKDNKALLEIASPFLPIEFFESGLDNEKIIALEKPRLKKLSELPNKVQYFYEAPKYDKNLLVWKQMVTSEVLEALNKIKKLVEDVSAGGFDKERLESIFLKAIGEGDKGRILWPFRVALTGRKVSPGPFEIAEILGKEESLRRIDFALNITSYKV